MTYLAHHNNLFVCSSSLVCRHPHIKQFKYTVLVYSRILTSLYKSSYNNNEQWKLYYILFSTTTYQARSWLSISGGALQKECNRGAGMILTRPPPPPPPPKNVWSEGTSSETSKFLFQPLESSIQCSIYNESHLQQGPKFVRDLA
jgi:hypothetical protein